MVIQVPRTSLELFQSAESKDITRDFFDCQNQRNDKCFQHHLITERWLSKRSQSLLFFRAIKIGPVGNRNQTTLFLGLKINMFHPNPSANTAIIIQVIILFISVVQKQILINANWPKYGILSLLYNIRIDHSNSTTLKLLSITLKELKK